MKRAEDANELIIGVGLIAYTASVRLEEDARQSNLENALVVFRGLSAESLVEGAPRTNLYVTMLSVCNTVLIRNAFVDPVKLYDRFNQPMSPAYNGYRQVTAHFPRSNPDYVLNFHFAVWPNLDAFRSRHGNKT